MIMLETVLILLVAAITIFIAGLLVRRQNKFQETIQELNSENQDILEDMASEISMLTGEKLSESTLDHLEKRMEVFNKTLGAMKNTTYSRRNRDVKY